ncbi:2,4-diaminopentanoate dehydrogenase [Vallitalea okinawensis]|uniref:2,4-diaminopentanoate dehydrogenase n=1 Tax=Vallitalea okinawensis TaxID=2078660 RepID=UPI000CFB70D3|nr:2,4-diaminopentanoate dehydrogenase [Vallitalea okinawensis]
MDNVKVIIWGFGAMGSGMANMLLKKKGVEIVGVCDIDPNKVGKSMFEVLNAERNNHPEVILTNEIESIIQDTKADVALLCTDSFTKGAFPKIKLLVEHGLNVVSTAEEMSYPKAGSPELAEEINRLAKANNVTVLGTGINPGLMMDFLAIVLTGACEEVEEIECERVNNLSPFGPVVMEEQGVGITVEEFDRKTEEGTLAGHVGFAESIEMIADGIGWKLDGPITQSQEAIVSSVYRKAPFAEVEAGNVAGVRMLGQGMVDGQRKLNMIHPQQVEPQLEGVHTGDYIRIKGIPNIDMSITPEVPGGIGTIAMCVNMIPHVINARSGLKTMLDLPVPRAIMGDMRDLIEE